jgi:acyl carrier protein
MPTDWPTLLAARRGRNLSLFAEYARGLDSAAGGSSLAERLPTLPAAERIKLLTPLVRDAAGRVLKLAPARIDANKPLGSMGLNSLMAMELRNRLEAALGRALSATIAWNYPTVQALVGFLAADTADAAPPAAAPERQPDRERPALAETAALAEVAELSDEEAARLLRRRR